MIMSINYGRNKNIAADSRKHFAVSLFAKRFHRASIVYFHSKYISFRCQRFIELFSELVFFPFALCVILCLFWYLFVDLPVVLSVALAFSFAFVSLSIALLVALCLSHSTFRSPKKDHHLSLTPYLLSSVYLLTSSSLSLSLKLVPKLRSASP